MSFPAVGRRPSSAARGRSASSASIAVLVLASCNFAARCRSLTYAGTPHSVRSHGGCIARGQGFHSSVTFRLPPVISSARERETRPREEREPPSPRRNSDSCQPSPIRGGVRIASWNPPATTASTIWVISSINPSAVSSQASQPQTGNGSVRQEPNLTCSPGNSEKATTIGAACGSCGVSLIAGRARLSLPSSWSASGPFWMSLTARLRTLAPAGRATPSLRRAEAGSVPGWLRGSTLPRAVLRFPTCLRACHCPWRRYRLSTPWRAPSSWLSSSQR